jgi:putative multiple sugar transport system substrate-binding protein
MIKSMIVGLALGLVAVVPQVSAQEKPLIAISMPTKSSARWIADGASMVQYFQEKGYKTDLQYAEDRYPQSAGAD